MAFDSANLSLMASANGFHQFRYDSTDFSDDIDDGGYFNNVDDNLNVGVGDTILAVSWTTAVRTGTINLIKSFVVTFVGSGNEAGRINVSEFGVDTAGALSSGDI